MVYPPWYRDDPVECMAFNLYALSVEEERDRAEKIEKFITFLSQTEDPNDIDCQLAAARYAGINEFSPAEQEYIEKEVARRWNA